MEQFLNAKILVTGGAGFVGGNLVRRLLTQDAGTIHIVDNLLSSDRRNIPHLLVSADASPATLSAEWHARIDEFVLGIKR